MGAAEQNDLFSVVTKLPQKPKKFQFQQSDLIEELLSLSHDQITPQIAKLIAREVDSELHRRESRPITPELVSELVAVKLEELGLIEKTSRRVEEPIQPISEELPLEVLEKFTEAPVEQATLLQIHPKQRKLATIHNQTQRDFFVNRFSLRSDEGTAIETLEDIFNRVSSSLSQAETRYAPNTDLAELEIEFYNLLATGEFLPDPLLLKNCGKPLSPLSVHSSIPVADSLESIFESLKKGILLHKHGAQTGFSFGTLRPKSDSVFSTHEKSAGPLSFLQIFKAAYELLEPKRGFRSFLPIHHPDILDFLDTPDFQKSVCVTQTFFNAVQANLDHPFINPRNGEPVAEVRARVVFKKLIQSILEGRVTGIIFSENLEAANPTAKLGALEVAGAQDFAALPFETAPSGVLSLPTFVKNGAFNWHHFSQAIQSAVHFLENALTIQSFAFSETERVVMQTRKINLGLTGFASLLEALNIGENTEEAINLANQLSQMLQETAQSASIHWGKKRGVFSVWNHSPYFTKNEQRRHAAITGIPANELSAIMGVSPGLQLQNTSLEFKLQIQAQAEAFLENLVHQPLNLPKETTETDVAVVLLKAFDLNLKSLAF